MTKALSSAVRSDIWVWFHPVILALVTLASTISSAQAQLVVGGQPGVPCTLADKAMGALSPPASGITQIFDIYDDDGIPDPDSVPDCWRHAHPNGLDFVYIDGEWERNPAFRAAATGHITGVFRVLSDARRIYGNIDGEDIDPISFLLIHDPAKLPPSPLYEFFVETIAGALPVYPSRNDRCLILFGGGRGSFDPRDLTGDSYPLFSYYAAHEIAHCYQGAHIPALPSWIFESSANFMASLVSPNGNGEHKHVFEFDLDGHDFRQAYGAFILLEFANQVGGFRPVWDLSLIHI